MLKTAAALAALLALGACGSFKTIDEERQIASSGLIGCRPADISISDNQQYTWTSTCAGRSFQCTVAPSMACAQLMK